MQEQEQVKEIQYRNDDFMENELNDMERTHTNKLNNYKTFNENDDFDLYDKEEYKYEDEDENTVEYDYPDSDTKSDNYEDYED